MKEILRLVFLSSFTLCGGAIAQQQETSSSSASDLKSAALSLMTKTTSEPPAETKLLGFIPCKEKGWGLNIWGFSHHTGTSNTKLNENNYGEGVSFSCDNLSVGVDMLKNSNRGRALLGTILWNLKFGEAGGFIFGSKLGVGALSYQVPKYQATIHGNTEIVYFYAKCGKEYFCNGFSVNLAPVPKLAGKAYIMWFTMEF